MNKVDFTIAHISDLHFSSGTDLSNQDHAHSIPHLVALQSRIENLRPNMVVLSGDVSNHGDKQSLINASAYLFKKIAIGENKYTGLNLSPENLGIVPGNHDAWNASKTGRLVDRRQRSLEHFNFAFPLHEIPYGTGCHYDWHQLNGAGIYFAYVDSCFLGDTDPHSDSPFGTIRWDQAIAKGKLTVHQTEKLLEWHDLGTKGALQDPRNQGKFINKEAFTKGLKILVMHHYLFEPSQHTSDYFMRIHHRNIVFRNIAFSDFDMLLCGHKHIPAFEVETYGRNFDRRATSRYLINYFRRLIGLHSLPVQIEDGGGRRWTKVLTVLTNAIVKMVIRKKPSATPAAVAEEVLRLLKEGLDDPDGLEVNVKTFLSEHGLKGAEVVERVELKEIQKRIAVGLTLAERKALQTIANRVAKITKKLHSRAFLQIMSGSTAKACNAADKQRSLNILCIGSDGADWNVRCERYMWDWDASDFLDDPLVQVHKFSRGV